jgi:hypothetical protein
MTNSKTEKNEDKAEKDEAAHAARERELLDLIKRAEAKKSGSVPPSDESPHDFIERQMRDKPKT